MRTALWAGGLAAGALAVLMAGVGMGAADPTPGRFFLFVGGQALVLACGSGLFIRLYAHLLGRPGRSALREPLAAIAAHRRLFASMHVAAFGAIVALTLVAYAVPAAQHGMLAKLMHRAQDPRSALGLAAAAYGSGSVLLAAVVTLAVNFLGGALASITLPSLILPGAGVLVVLVRACIVGVALAPTSAKLFGAMGWHTGTILMETEGYILSAFFGLMVPVYVFGRKEGETRLGGYLKALRLNARGSVLVLAVLAVSALYEATEVIAQMSARPAVATAQQQGRPWHAEAPRGWERKSATVSLKTAALCVCCFRPAASGAGLHDVDRARALGALLDVKLHDLVLSQGLETDALNGAVVDEHVRRAVIRGDETEALGVTEPLYFALSHCQTFAKKQLFFVRADARKRISQAQPFKRRSATVES
jgi:hypothetical protein